MNYRIENKRIQVQNIKTGKYYDFCEQVYVRKIFVDLFSDRCNVEICIEKPNRTVPIIIPRDEVDKNIVKTLRAIDFKLIDTPLHAEMVNTILEDSEKNATYVFTHDRLGFHTLHDEQMFFAYNPIGSTNQEIACSEHYLPKMTKPSGTYEAWHDLMTTYALGRPELELALALSAVAPIAHLLTEKNVLDLVPVIAFIGKSSTSKTTTLKMIASVFGAPNLRDGILSNLNATDSAFCELLSNRNGYPTLIDETSILPKWDFASTLYNIPTGRSKLRCDSNGNLKETKNYSGCIFLTGEYSLFEQLGCDDNSGIRARLIQFGYQWASSAEHAEAIEKGCRENYGTAVYPLIEWLVANQDDLAVAYKKRRKKIKDELAKRAPQLTGISERVIKTYALILLGASVVKAALDLELDYAAIKKLLIDHFVANYSDAKTEKEDPSEQIYDYLMQQVVKNTTYYPPKEEISDMRTVYGIQDFGVIWVMSSEFKPMFQAAKKMYGLYYKRDKDILDDMHEKKYILRCAADRFTKRVKLKGKLVSCYGLLTGQKISEAAKKKLEEKEEKAAEFLRMMEAKKRMSSLLDSSEDSDEEESAS